MKKVKIVPAILVKNLKQFKEKVRAVEKDFRLVQIDIADGKFVKNKTFARKSKIQTVKTPLNYELHLMVKDPARVIKEWENFPKVKRIIIHFETVKADELEALVLEVKNQKKQVGIAINPETPTSKIKPWLDKIDLVLMMGVHPGWTGQPFQASTYRKIKAIRKLDKKILISVDGGVSDKRSKKLIEAGANILCSGSYLFNQGDVKKAKRKLLA